MQIDQLPEYDFTRLTEFQKAMSMTEPQKEEMNLIIKDMINHFFENVNQAVEIAVTNKIIAVSKDVCAHCNLPIAIRDPSGTCDHLYYPEMCEVCKNGQ